MVTNHVTDLDVLRIAEHLTALAMEFRHRNSSDYDAVFTKWVEVIKQSADSLAKETEHV